jgi:hypothetical protein
VTPLEHALAYAALGWRVAPIKPGFKFPKGLDNWQERATTDEATIRKWWGKYPDYGVSIVAGVISNIVWLDVDPRHGGDETLADLEHEHGALPDTVESLTGGGGRHIGFKMPRCGHCKGSGVIAAHDGDALDCPRCVDGRLVITNDAGKRLGPGLDVRGEGGQIVAPPSIHPETGRAYAWEVFNNPLDGAEVADMPAWLVDMLTAPLTAPTPRRTPHSSGTRLMERPGDRYNAEAAWADQLTRDGWTLHSARRGRDGDYELWTGPHKTPDQGASASLYYGGSNSLKVFTSSVPGLAQNAAYDPLGYLAATKHGGDIGRAVKALGDEYRRRDAPTPTQNGTPAMHLVTTPTDDEIEEPVEDYDSILQAMLLNWPDFWAQDHGEVEWLAEPLIPAKRSVAIFAPGGTGKSLLALWIAANLATGRDPMSLRPIEPISVLYLDYEMTADDLAERLEQMGVHDTDLTHLHYALLPSLPGLDEPEGGTAVVRMAELVDARLVIIDTFGRAVHGDENDADTVRAWYRWTGLHLKAAGRAFARVDHAGKDLAKGQRGTSAKNDDVDVVWQMATKDAGCFTLTAKKRRMGWVPETVDIVMDDDPLSFRLARGPVLPDGTNEMAIQLDELGLPVEASARDAQRALRTAGRKGRNNVIAAAVKYRKERSPTYHFTGDPAVDKYLPTRETQSGNASGNTPSESSRGTRRGTPEPEQPLALLNGSGNASGNAGEHPPDASGEQRASRSGARVPSVTQEEDF